MKESCCRLRRCRRAASFVRMDEQNQKKRLIVVGDRVLVEPEQGEERSRVGLYLPASAVDNQAVQAGTVVARGPGTPVSAPTELDEEPWKIGSGEARYLPVQARVGDYAIFFRRAAVEITFEGKKYLVVPQAAILVLVRDEEIIEPGAW
jgi:chaperonin GroES